MKLATLSLLTLMIAACGKVKDHVEFQIPTEPAQIVINPPAVNVTVTPNITITTGDTNVTVSPTIDNSNSNTSTGGSVGNVSATGGTSSSTSAGGNGGAGGTSSNTNTSNITSGNSTSTGGTGGGASAGNSTSNANNSGSNTTSNSGSVSNSGSQSATGGTSSNNNSNSSDTSSSSNSGGNSVSGSNTANSNSGGNTVSGQGSTSNSDLTNGDHSNNSSEDDSEDNDSGNEHKNKDKKKKKDKKSKKSVGLTCKVYNLSSTQPSNLPNFSNLNPVATITIDQLDVSDVDYAGSFPKFPQALKGMLEWYGLVCDGTIKVPKTTTYTFFLTSDDGSKLYIDGSLLINNDGLHSTRAYQNSLTLSKGNHDVHVEYFQGPRTRISLVLEWSSSDFARQVLGSSFLKH